MASTVVIAETDLRTRGKRSGQENLAPRPCKMVMHGFSLSQIQRSNAILSHTPPRSKPIGAPGRSRRSPLSDSGCSPSCRRKAKTAAVTVKVFFSADELRQDIRWVVLPRDPCHFDLLLADGSLQPEERHRHVPDLPDASPPADAPASRAIRVDPYLHVDPEILCHGLHRETLSPALDRGAVLRLARTHGDHRLGRAPDLQASTVPHDAASIGGLLGPLTAGPIAVNEDLEILARLPDDRDSLYHPGDSPEIPAQFLEGCPAAHLRAAHLAAQLLDRVPYVRPVLDKEVTPGDDGPVLPSGLPVEFLLAVLLLRPLGSGNTDASVTAASTEVMSLMLQLSVVQHGFPSCRRCSTGRNQTSVSILMKRSFWVQQCRPPSCVALLLFSLFLLMARRGVEGEGKSCRPPLGTPHVPVLTS